MDYEADWIGDGVLQGNYPTNTYCLIASDAQRVVLPNLCSIEFVIESCVGNVGCLSCFTLTQANSLVLSRRTRKRY